MNRFQLLKDKIEKMYKEKCEARNLRFVFEESDKRWLDLTIKANPNVTDTYILTKFLEQRARRLLELERKALAEKFDLNIKTK